MTGRERMLKTLRFEEPDRPPHFEVMFELEKEAFGLQFPERHAWEGCTAGEKDRLVGQCMTIYEKIVARYLTEQVAHVRSLGLIPFIHSDGNLMPVLEDWIGTGAACFQSVDPMAGMDLAEVKRRSHGKMALMGNVQCNLLQDGPREAIRRSARYCLEHGAPGGGYIFGTSNTVFPGMPLAHYEYMLEVYQEWVTEQGRRT